MQKPRGYDTARAVSDDNTSGLTPGGYICQIKNIAEQMSKNGHPMVRIEFDIAEGEFKGYFKGLYDRYQRDTWPVQGTIWRMTEDKDGFTNPRFKYFIQAVEKSNPRLQVEWGDGFSASLKGAYIGVLFRNEEEESYQNEGEYVIRLRPYAIEPVEVIRNKSYKEPKDKLIPEDKKKARKAELYTMSSFTAIDEDLPF